MFKIIRTSLVCLILILTLPASTNAASINDGNQTQSYQTGSECGADSDCTQIPPSFQPDKSEGENVLSWEGNAIPVLEAGPDGTWDQSGVIGPEVLHTGTQYLMYYTGVSETTYQIGFATSYSGLTWEKYPGNPVLSVGNPGSWDDKKVWAPAVIHRSSIWEMWYVGYNDVTGSQIGYASSQDGLNWVKYWDNPVFSPGLFHEWESSGLLSPFITFEDGIYHMWYSNDPNGYIGYAISSDGIHWERYPDNPLIQPTGGDEENCSPTYYVSPTILHLDEYHMWYQAGATCRGDTGCYWIVHSTSPDRVTWSEPEWAFGCSAPMLNAHYPTVVSHHNGLLKQMWYASYSNIYYAEENQLDIQNLLPIVIH